MIEILVWDTGEFVLRIVVCGDSGGTDGDVDEEDWESRMRTSKAKKVNDRVWC